MKRRDFIKTIAGSTAAPLVLGSLIQCAKPQKTEKSALMGGETLLFIGDSITQNASYINYIETFLLSKYPDKYFNVIGLGLSSETVCGLTEPVHPYPRPNVHERLDRILERTKPDIVMSCYGMNDGIYAPLSEERFVPYQQGIQKVIDKVRTAGVKHQYVITPPPFDPVPVKDKVVDENAELFGFGTPFENYDSVLKQYGEWIMTLAEADVTPVDIHTPMSEHVKANRAKNPEYYLARDGVHPGPAGHWIMAATILEAWHEAPVTNLADIRINDKKAEGTVENISISGDVVFDWKLNVPVALQTKDVETLLKIESKLVNPVLQVQQSSVGGYKVYQDNKLLRSFSKDDLEKGIDFSGIPAFEITYRGTRLLNLVGQRRQIYDGSLREDIGHKKPKNTKPLSMAEAERRKPEMDAQVELLSRPGVVNMRLVPYI